MRWFVVLGFSALTSSLGAGCGGDEPCVTSSECGSEQVCVDGACRDPETPVDGGRRDSSSSCLPPRMSCSGACVDVQRNPDHCGACDTPCVAPSFCSGGVCTRPCMPSDPPTEVCNGVDDDCNGVVDLPGCGDGLVAWYRFEETEGPVVDSSGNGLHGEALGSLTRGVAGHEGMAASLDGAAGTMVRVADAPATTFGMAFTAEAWISALDCSHGASGHNTVVAKEGEFLLAFNPSCSVANYINTGAWQLDAAGRTVPLFSWVHYAVTYDGAMIRSYLDGRAVGPGTALTGSIPDTMVGMYIGARPDCCEQTLRGRVDDVRIWSVVRAASEICASAGHVWNETAGTCG